MRGKRVPGMLVVLITLFALNGASAWAASDLEEGVKDLADKITKGMTEKGTRKVALIDFSDLNGNVTALGQFMAEELTTQLYLMAPGKFEVVERRQLLKLEAELALGQMGVIEEKSLKKMGQVLGVEAVVTGSMTDLGNTIKVNARMIAVESAQVFAVAATSIPKTGIVAELASKTAEKPSLAGAPPTASAPQSSASVSSGGGTASKWMMETDKLIISVDELKVGLNKASMFLTYQNKTADVVEVVLLTKPTLDSSEGKHYYPDTVFGGNVRVQLGTMTKQGMSLVKLSPRGKSTVPLTFSASHIRQGTTFSLISQQAYVEPGEAKGGLVRNAEQFFVTIRNIEPR